MAYPNGTIDTPLSSGDIAERLAAKVHAGVFYPGYRGIGLRRGWLYEGKVTDEGFSIRRITSLTLRKQLCEGSKSSFCGNSSKEGGNAEMIASELHFDCF